MILRNSGNSLHLPKMDEDEYVEVRIIDPVAKIPTSDVARSTKALSTIQEHANSKAFHSYEQNGVQRNAQNSKKLRPNDQYFPSSPQRVDSFRNLNQPFDIDLLLRYYACNANMEKSIHKVLTKADEKCFNYSHDPLVNQVCKDRDQGPLVELRALYKIFDSLKRSASEDTILSPFRFHDIIAKLQAVIGRCNDKQLEQILSSDPSIKMCKHCGVISCSNSGNVSIQPRKSQPRTSYFLNTQIFSDNASNDNNNSKLYREMEKFRKKQATTRTGKGLDMQKNAKQSTYTRYTDNKRYCSSRGVNVNFKRLNKLGTSTPQRIETMVAERENENETQGMCPIHRSAETNLENNKNQTCVNIQSFAVKLQSSVNDTRMTKLSPFKEEQLKIEKTDKIINNSGTMRQMKSNSNFEVKDKGNNGSTANFLDKVDDIVRKEQNEQEMLDNSQQSVDECNEKVLKNILYVKSKSQLENIRQPNCISLENTRGMRNEQNQLLNYPNNISSIIDLMTYLAHGRMKSVDRKKKEFVSQLDERSRVQSRRSNNKHSFVLHASRDDNPQLGSAFKMCNELKYPNEANNNKYKDRKLHFRHYRKCPEHWKYIECPESNNGSDSVTCLMEDDSLENCTKASNSVLQSDQSNSTTCSSSSAENMIREWVKPPQTDKESSACDKTCESPVTLKSSTVESNVKHQTSRTNRNYLYCSQTSVDRERGLQIDGTNSARRPMLLKHQTKNYFSNEQTMPHALYGNSKLQNGQEPTNKRTNKRNSKKVEYFGTKKFFSKQLFGPLKSIKSMKPTRSEGDKHSSNNLLDDHLKNIRRRIVYSESSFRPTLGDHSRYGEVTNILLLYRKILEFTEGMDWKSFQKFIEDLHPSQKDLWCDVCNTVNNEAKRVADKGDVVTEVCIEISSVPCEGTKNEGRTCNNEIVFEMNMALRDVERFLDWKRVSTEKAQFDTLQEDSQVIEVQNDDVCNTEVDSNQAD